MIKLDLPCAMHPSEQLQVSGQPSAHDLERAALAGLRSVINLRPDDETPDRDQRAEAQRAGLDYLHLPIDGPKDVTPSNAERLRALLAQAPRPTLVYCGSANRVGALFALLARQEGSSPEQALAWGRAHGLKGLEAHVASLL